MARRKKVDFNLASEIFDDASLADSFQEEPNHKTMIKLTSLITNPYQPRMQIDNESIEELAKSIEENGLLQPITLLNNHDETYTIVFGHRRVTAYEYLDKIDIEANVLNSLENNSLMISPIVENLQRKDMEPIETAIALNTVLSIGVIKTQNDLAKLLGISQGRISKLLSIIKLDKTVLKEITTSKYKDATVLASLNKIQLNRQLALFNAIKNLSRSEALDKIKNFTSNNNLEIKRVFHGNNSIKINTKGISKETKNLVQDYINKIESLLKDEDAK